MGKRLPLRILVAEDNAINQQVALSFLERLGYHADVAANGREVIQSLERQPYDLVLMDVQMPEMDGLEATRYIRGMSAAELAAEAQPRIVAMTASALREDRQACLAAGMEDYLSKPIQVKELVAALSKCQPGLTRGVREEPRPTIQAMEGGTQTPQESSQVLDAAALRQLRTTLGNKADVMLPGLIEGFYQDTDRLIAKARQALRQQQPDSLRVAAHSLKSTSAIFGAGKLSAIASQLESSARDGALKDAARLIEQAQVEFARARTELERVGKTL
jgi:CheY-like chemotaxis protein